MLLSGPITVGPGYGRRHIVLFVCVFALGSKASGSMTFELGHDHAMCDRHTSVVDSGSVVWQGVIKEWKWNRRKD